MNLQDKVVAITGGGRGLGAAMARRLAGQSCKLALIDMDPQTLQSCADECRKAGASDVAVYPLNVTEEAAVESAFTDIGERFGALHGLVNNAGITRDGFTLKFDGDTLVKKMSLEQWQAVIDVNLTGVFLCGREAAATMITTGSEGCIINISSISRGGNMGQLNYSAAKSAVAAMAVVWAKEFARYGIRAASIAPGFIATEMVSSMKPEALAKMSAAIPTGRLGEPDEIASTVQFILENDYINGRCFDVDGGLRL